MLVLYSLQANLTEPVGEEGMVDVGEGNGIAPKTVVWYHGLLRYYNTQCFLYPFFLGMSLEATCWPQLAVPRSGGWAQPWRLTRACLVFSG